MPIAASLRRASGWALLLATGLAGAQQQDFSKVEIEVIPVRSGIYMLSGSGGNIGLLTGPDGAIMIDDQYAPLSDKIRAAVASVTAQPLRLLINTHWHGDHTGGNEAFGGSGAIIVAHENVRKRMSAPFFSSFFQREVPASPAVALPVVTFADAVTLHLNGQTLAVEHLPAAHTDGDAIIRFVEANVVHMGDLFFNGLYPFIDHASGGSVPGMLAAIDRVLPTLDADTRVIPGHGPLSDRAGLQAFRDMLATVAGRVAAMAAEDRSVEDIVAAQPSAEYDETWGKAFLTPERFVRLVCQSYACRQ